MGMSGAEIEASQTVEAKVEAGGKTFSTTKKFTALYVENGAYQPKELALQTLKALVEKMETEIAAGNLE